MAVTLAAVLILLVPLLILWRQHERAKARGLAAGYPISQQARDGFVFVVAGTVLLARVAWWGIKWTVGVAVAALVVTGLILFILEVGS